MLQQILKVILVVGTPLLGPNVFAQNRTAERGASDSNLIFSCRVDNDLFKAVTADGTRPNRFDSPEEAINQAPAESGVLILADDYPIKTVRVPDRALAAANAKRLRLYIEYPDALPGIKFAAPRQVHWERAVIASKTVDLGLPELRILSLHDCRFLPTDVADPAIVVARVAGFDTAVYGLPKERHPILFKTSDGMLVATTQLSNFNRARYAPTAEWRTIWQCILDELHPSGAPHCLEVTPTVRPAYDKDAKLPANAEETSLARAADWVHRSRLLVANQREAQLHKLLQTGVQEAPAPAATEPDGDGRFGIVEGYASRIAPDGSQSQAIALRADCQAETAAVLAMYAFTAGDRRSRKTAENLLDYLYFTSDLCRGARGDPRHPAFGLIAWGSIAPAWYVGNYGDDNARTLLATMVAAASLKSDKWDEPMLRALMANLRTTNELGFRGDRVDVPALEQHGWRHFRNARTVNQSPHFEGYLWACYLWAYARTGDERFLDRTTNAIRTTMEAYPNGWRWGDNLERAHMLLPLAWLVRVDDTAEHREWLHRIAGDLLADQSACGAIAERLRAAGGGHYVVPATNEAYGTTETPLLQEHGDPVSDQLYTTGFALLGLREAAAATGDERLRSAENRLADYLIRIQVRSDTVPYLDGAWFRAFDFKRWDYWASSADLGWGAWSVESGWGPAWIPVVFGLRANDTTLWELTSSSKIARHMDAVDMLMSENDGGPYMAE